VRCQHDDNGNPVRHCRVRRRCNSHLEHGEYACPRCLAMIRTNLHDIVDKLALMSDEATEQGVNSEAANLAGPHASPPELKRRLIWQRSAGIEVEELDPNDPVTVLAVREQCIREDLGHDELVLCSPTVAQSAAYLEWVLTDLARDETQVVILSDLMAETARLVAHLDAVRHDQQGTEAGAPCPNCPVPAPKLRRQWGRQAKDDRWVCPADRGHAWDDVSYRKWVRDDYVSTADTLNMTDMAERTTVAPGTLRRWASKPTGAPDLKPCGRDSSGRKVYRVADVEALQERTDSSRRVS
jgi:hypothetical protein